MKKLFPFGVILALVFFNVSPAFAQLGSVTPPADVTPPPVTDLCPNIAGVQASIPAGTVIDGSGNCVTPIPADTTPPVVSGIANASLGITEATIVWTTNELAVSTFEYGTTQSYGSSASVSAGVAIGGTAVLTGLTGGTTYYYCIHATDASGNVSASCGHSFTTAPAPVVVSMVPPVVSVVTISPLGASTATVNWTTDSLATAQVEYGTTASYGMVTSPDNTLASVHSVSLSGLAPNTIYHYAIKTADSNGNLTTTSDATFTTGALPQVNVQAPADTIPPVISGAGTASLGISDATIVWNTNELATSNLTYGLTQSYGSDAILPLSAFLAHTATLTNLTPETTYYYCIAATDIAGNTAQSCGQSFTTTVAPIVADTNPPTILAVAVAPVTTTSASVSWTTDEIANGQVQYGTTANYGSETSLDTSLSLTHSTPISGLSPNTLYHYRIISKDGSGNGAESPDNTFTTDALPIIPSPATSPSVPTTTPLVIVSTQSSSVTTSAADVSWSTNMPTTGTLSSGTTASYGLMSASNASQIFHSVIVSDLLPDTTYHYQVQAVNSVGESVLSADQTFTTSALPVVTPPADTIPPVISLVNVLPVATSSATINWSTNELADSQVYYGTTPGYGLSSTIDTSPSLIHSIPLSSLTPDTTYHYQIRSTDAAGNLAVGSDDTFTTSALSVQVGGNAPAIVSPLVISAIDTAVVGGSGVTITWQTDVPSDSQIEYGVNSNFGSLSTLDSSLNTSHSVTLTGLNQNTNYAFRVKSQAVGTPVAIVSDTHEFNTLADQTAIETTVPANITNVSATPASASLMTATSTSAMVMWSTDKSATSQVEYGVSTSYGEMSMFDGTPVTSHSVNLTNLEPATTYQYRVKSIDSDGDITFSNDNSFTTASPLSVPGASLVVINTPSAVTDAVVASYDSQSAALAWNVPSPLEDVASAYDIRYSTEPITDGNFANATPVQSTAVTYSDLQSNGTARTYVVTGLNPVTTYYFAIKSKYGGSAWSAISNIPSAVLPAVPSNPSSPSVPVATEPIGSPTNVTASGDASQITLNWSNPTSMDFVRTIIVEKDGSYPTSPTDGAVIYDGRGETFTDLEAQDGIKDYYALYSFDQDSNYSAPVTISLDAQAGVTETKVYASSQPQGYRGGGGAARSYSNGVGTAFGSQQVRLTQYSFPDAIGYGDTGTEVQHLQQILVAHPDLYPQNLVTGYFGDYTKAAIQAFQTKQGLPVTGIADPQTAAMLNALSVTDPILMLQPETSSFDKDLSYGMTDPDVEALQHFLIQDGDYPEGVISEYFGPLTQKAVIAFQNKYAITPAAGYVGILTRTKIKSLLGL